MLANAPHPLSERSTGHEIQSFEFPWQRSPDQDAHALSGAVAHHPIVIVGAGPAGLSLAIDLAQRGQRVLLLDNDARLSSGSRAICFAKRTLEIWDRLGVGQAMCDKGVQWQMGKVFLGSEQLYGFNLLPEPGHERPAFINLQQYYAEAFLAIRAAQLPTLEIRWHNTVTALEQPLIASGLPGPSLHAPAVEHDPRPVRLTIETPEGPYTITADYVAACDGSRSSLRTLLGQQSTGQVFRDRFLIADVRMQAPFPTERWFWFDPPFHPNQSVLLHRQPDDVWRIDFQLGWDVNPDEEKRPERVRPRVDAMMRQAIGHEVPFELEWASVYTFSCQRMASFRHGHVLFAGDSAHGVSPFGARGANSSVQDSDNLAWKLDLVLRGIAPEALLATYAAEREYAADENILNSTRSTDFITPKSPISKLFRDATLNLAREHGFARRLVNSGRLSVPATLNTSTLNTPDCDHFEGTLAPGAPALDAPILKEPHWLLRCLAGNGFHALIFDGPQTNAIIQIIESAFRDGTGPQIGTHQTAASPLNLPVNPPVIIVIVPCEGLAAKRYDASPGTTYLLRPDQHVCARWREPSSALVRAALRRALAREPSQ